jgi:hypothetical protein
MVLMNPSLKQIISSKNVQGTKIDTRGIALVINHFKTIVLVSVVSSA